MFSQREVLTSCSFDLSLCPDPGCSSGPSPCHPVSDSDPRLDPRLIPAPRPSSDLGPGPGLPPLGVCNCKKMFREFI